MLEVNFLPYCGCGNEPKQVIYHPYESARAFPIIAEFAYNHGDEVDQLENYLIEKSFDEKGKKGYRDNKIVLEVIWDDDTKVFFWFHDWKLRIGLKLFKK